MINIFQLEKSCVGNIIRHEKKFNELKTMNR